MVETSHLVRLLDSGNVSDWSARLFSMARDLGFDQVLYGISRSRHAPLENTFLRSNYSPAWRAHYDSHGLFFVDPTVRHCGTSLLPIVWRPQTFCGKAEHDLYEEACAHGIRAGISLPVHGPGGEAGILSFARDSHTDAGFERDVAQCLPVMSLLRDYVFSSSLQFFHPEAGGEEAPRLTRRELEVLRWVMAGKSSWEISRILNCSEATVNFHMANVRQKFNVNTRQQAVVKAISLGLLTPEDHRR